MALPFDYAVIVASVAIGYLRDVRGERRGREGECLHRILETDAEKMQMSEKRTVLGICNVCLYTERKVFSICDYNYVVK